MNSHEAFAKLGLSPGADEKDVDAAFRKQAAKLHPDVNKAPTAEQDFKDLNEAYQFLKKHNNKEAASFRTTFHYTEINPNDFINEIKQRMYESMGNMSGDRPHIYYNQGKIKAKKTATTVTISFAESVIGCVKDVKYKRKMVCVTCGGTGYVSSESGSNCDKCDGTGNREIDGKILPCTTCRGKGKMATRKLCHECHGSPLVDKMFETKVKIPAGITNKTILSLQGKGDVDTRGFRAYNDAMIEILVEPDAEIHPIGRNVTSFVKLSLLEAIQGTTKEVRTVKGTKSLKIPGPRRHGDQLEADGLGYPPDGKHIFILDVEYPKNLDKLIEFLGGPKADGYIDNESPNNCWANNSDNL